MRQIAILTILFSLATPVESPAHHSVMRGYDTGVEIQVTGRIVSAEWRNPHSRIVLAVMNQAGTNVQWTIETNAAETIERLGPAAGFNMQDFAVGETVTIGGWKGRRRHSLYLTWALFDNGKKIIWRASATTSAIPSTNQ